MFKKGDRIRFIGTSRVYDYYRGKEGEVLGVSVLHGEETVLWKQDGKTYPTNWLSERFELVTPLEPTDQELADEYRETLEKSRNLCQELLQRGYRIAFDGQMVSVRPINSVLTITKTITTKVEL